MSIAMDLILVVEDERSVARGLEYGLKSEGFAVLVAETAEKALQFARNRNPRLILLDIRLPDGSGFDVCRTLRDEGMRQPILMVTARDEEVDRVLGLELGADDYIVKPFSFRELVSRIRASLRRAYGELASDSGSGRVSFGDVVIDFNSLQALKAGKPVYLTATELRLAHGLVSRPGQVFSRDSLIETVWGYDASIDYGRTVDVHIRHLREKLEDDPSRPRWFVTVRGIGYKFQP